MEVAAPRSLLHLTVYDIFRCRTASGTSGCGIDAACSARAIRAFSRAFNGRGTTPPVKRTVTWHSMTPWYRGNARLPRRRADFRNQRQGIRPPPRRAAWHRSCASVTNDRGTCSWALGGVRRMGIAGSDPIWGRCSPFDGGFAGTWLVEKTSMMRLVSDPLGGGSPLHGETPRRPGGVERPTG